MKKVLIQLKILLLNKTVKLFNSLSESNRKESWNLYALLNYIINALFQMKSFQVISHAAYSEFYAGNKDASILFPNRIGYSSNLVYNRSRDTQKLMSYPMQDIMLYHYKNLCICGDSDFIIDNEHNAVINDICYNKDERIKYHDSIMLDHNKKTVLIRHGRNAIALEDGIVMSGLFSRNYYHSLYDNLVRIVALEKSNIPENVPYLIDRATVEISSLKSAFDCLTKMNKRKYIVLEPRQLYHVNNMYYITHVNHIIPSIQSYNLCQPADTVFDLDLTMEMRNRLLTIKSDKVFPEKFFISRKHTSRRNFNEDEVFSVLQKMGFERVFPEDLTFEEQIALFNKAKCIVGGGGAAMTNLMFCNKDCKVLIINKTMDQVPCFTTIPYAIGVTIRHYGNENNDKSLHSDYVVKPQDVVNCLKFLMGNNG